MRLATSATRISEQPLKIRSAALSQMLAEVTVLLARALFGTLRIEEIEADPGDNPYPGDAEAICISRLARCHHGAAVFRPSHRMVALMSRHRDGSFVAYALSG